MSAQVDRDVEHLSFRCPNQLPLRMLDLIVQATQHAAPRARMIVLHEVDVDAAGREGAPVPAFKEEARARRRTPWARRAGRQGSAVGVICMRKGDQRTPGSRRISSRYWP
jgi:hypothetical protein